MGGLGQIPSHITSMHPFVIKYIRPTQVNAMQVTEHIQLLNANTISNRLGMAIERDGVEATLSVPCPVPY